MIRAALASLAACREKDSAWDISKIKKVSREICETIECVSTRSNDKWTGVYIFITRVKNCVDLKIPRMCRLQ